MQEGNCSPFGGEGKNASRCKGKRGGETLTAR